MDYSLYKIEDFLTDESFIKYCLREDPEVLKYWEAVLKNQPELAGTIHQAESLFMVLALKVDPIEKEKELDKLKFVIENETLADAVDSEIPQRIVRFKPKYAWLSAAAAAILIGIGVYSVMNRVDYSTYVPTYATVSALEEVKTKFNERRTVNLPDGSTVLLNGLTELKIDKDYNKNNRVLWLTGEAHFTVAKNADRPFIVISGKTATTALGTSFKINNYSRTTETSVMLTTGKVSVGTVNGQEVVNHVQLLPGEQVHIAEADNKFNKSTFSIQEVEDWRDRRLVFSMASLEKIRSVLKNIYGVEIITQNQPKKPIAFTGQFTNESLTEVLDAIGFSNHFTYSIKDDKVKLDFEK
ncbi:FecR family protein [Pedobacter nyackensis]|uniref:FecR family protein n=1 Tax=Pedobacter nyackensis TaxID=475255 RepID=UPI00292CC283|nr:FecR domain-containing protein [Pedobacter nyackensis]